MTDVHTEVDPPKANDTDKRPNNERKADDPKTPARAWFDNPNAGQAPRATERAQGDANTIGSPDVFLDERFRNLRQSGIRIRQVWSDDEKRGYAISNGKDLGYFELAEGMNRAEAEAALAGAYNGSAAIV